MAWHGIRGRARHKLLSRRAVLRGALAGGAAVCVGLPMLDIFLDDNGRALANGQAIPPRFGLFFWGNGVHPDRWTPTGEGPGWQVSEQLAPLAGLEGEVSVISGLAVKTPNTVPHRSGAAGILSGAPLIVESNDNTTFSAPSIDQVVAAEIGGQTRFRSLEFGAGPASSYSFNGPNKVNPIELDPYALFERIFGAGFRPPGADPGTVDPTLALRRSVLDAVADDLRQVRGGLGTADRARLEQHVEGVRDLELRLARLEEAPPMRAACREPQQPTGDFEPIDGRDQISKKNRIMCDIIAAALACDQTRVWSNHITSPTNNILFQGASAGHHQLTHDEPGDQPQVHAITLQLMAEFAYQVEALRSIPEGDGTLLDNCLLLGTSEVSYGRTHDVDNMPVLLAGTAGGALEKGQHLRVRDGENASKLHLSLMWALGIRAESFGQRDGRATEALSGLEAS